MNKVVLGEGRIVMQVEGDGVLAFYRANKSLPIGQLTGAWDDSAIDMEPILEIEGTVEGFQVLLATVINTIEVIEREKLNTKSLAV